MTKNKIISEQQSQIDSLLENKRVYNNTLSSCNNYITILENKWLKTDNDNKQSIIDVYRLIGICSCMIVIYIITVVLMVFA